MDGRLHHRRRADLPGAYRVSTTTQSSPCPTTATASTRTSSRGARTAPPGWPPTSPRRGTARAPRARPRRSRARKARAEWGPHLPPSLSALLRCAAELSGPTRASRRVSTVGPRPSRPLRPSPTLTGAGMTPPIRTAVSRDLFSVCLSTVSHTRDITGTALSASHVWGDLFSVCPRVCVSRSGILSSVLCVKCTCLPALALHHSTLNNPLVLLLAGALGPCLCAAAPAPALALSHRAGQRLPKPFRLGAIFLHVW